MISFSLKKLWFSIKYRRFSIFYKRSLHIEFTNRCNLLCKACYKGGPYAKYADINAEIGFKDLKRLFSLYDPERVLTIVISGGENLLYPHLFEVTEYIRKRYPDSPIILSTNTVALQKDEKLLHALGGSGIHIIQCSIHAATQDTLDCLQKGSNLSAALKVIDHLKRDYCVDVGVNFVVQQENLDEIIPFVHLIGKTSVKSISFTPINFSVITCDSVDYRKIWDEWRLRDRLAEARQIARDYNIQIPVFVPKCVSINQVDVITASGEMLPCWGGYFPKLHSMGNVFKSHPDDLRVSEKWQAMLNNSACFENALCAACYANGEYINYFSE